MKNPETPKKRKRVYEYSVWQDGLKVASVSSRSRKLAEKEILHYATMYRAEGKVIVKDDTRIRRTL